ncbi:hypothetical protein Trydic_g4421 [Trypoxylus dichotomus]
MEQHRILRMPIPWFTGNCGTNVIEGWFDIDSQTTEFLTWLSKNLSEENVVQDHEILEYEENVQQVLGPNVEHSNIINEISQKYPGIFDLSELECEVECLEDELNMLLEDKGELNNILHMHENLYKKEKASLARLEAEHVKSTNELEKTEDDCLKTSCHLDTTNNKLYECLTRCSEKLLEFEYPSSSTNLSNIPISKYYRQYKQIISYFGLLDKKEFASLPRLVSAVKFCSKLNGSIFHEKTDDDLNNLKKKLFQSIQNRNYTEAAKEQLQAELKYMDVFNISELMNSLRTRQQIESDIQCMFDHRGILSLELENLALEISEKYNDLSSISLAKQEVAMLQTKLTNAKQVENVFLTILSYHTLLYFALLTNYNDIQRADQFFRVVHQYIGNNLMKCELRMESMKDIIQQYNMYEKTPFEERNVLLQVLCKLLGNNNNNIGMHSNSQWELPFSNPTQDEKFHQQVRTIEGNNKVLHSFLKNGPTAELKVIPYKVHEIFREIDSTLCAKNNVVTTIVAIWKDTVKEASKNDWIKFKRQLWMYFLMHPQKVTKKDKTPPILGARGIINNSGKTEEFANYLEGTFRANPLVDMTHVQFTDKQVHTEYRGTINIQETTIEELQLIIKTLGDRKAPRHEGITNTAIKHLTLETIDTLKEIIDAIIRQQHY